MCKYGCRNCKYDYISYIFKIRDINLLQMCDLAGVVGMNCSAHQKLSPRLRNLCEEAQTMTAL